MLTLSRLCSLLILFSVTGCIGAGSNLHYYGADEQKQHGTLESDELLNRRLIGMSRDQLITEFGPPSRSASLDTGFKLMQYNRKTMWISQYGNRTRYNCELRLWLRDKIVRHVDYRGDQLDCIKFVLTGRQNVVEDNRPPK